jgi:peptidoglycan hydrolase-like protein with peptidoglycan-binding domain
MPKPTLKRRDKGEAVFELQSLLNRVGAMLIADGDFGLATETGVKYAQDFADQAITGIADPGLWDWLVPQPKPFPRLKTNGVAFIAAEETGGLSYYNIKTRWPHYPGVASGITIGVGYDLRWNSEQDFFATWGDHLSRSTLLELAKDIGNRGTKKRVLELKRAGIEVPFKSAWAVFVKKTLPDFYAQTQFIYPSLDRIPDFCRSVLVSLVFNRGTDLSGPRRKEMKNIQTILSKTDQPGLTKAETKRALEDVETEIVSMKRLWDSSSGLVKRRQAEANLWRDGLDQW